MTFGLRVNHLAGKVAIGTLDIDYETGEGNERFAYDTLTQGPVIGFTFRF